MSFGVFLQFAFATLLPVVASVVFYLLEKNTSFKTLDYKLQQVIIGVVFGVIAICGTEFGINAYGATMNVRDAAPIVAGLLFGGPAGIIAGIIGGVERWFAVFWGGGMFTRVGCSIATALMGFYAASLRKFMFDGKRPSWLIALAIGVVAEVLHLTLIFVTNMDTMEQAITVVRACTMPMLLCNGISVMLSVLAVMVLNKERLRLEPEETAISQTVQTSMFAAVFIAFIVTTGFLYMLQTALSNQQTAQLLKLNIDDVKKELVETSDETLLAVTNQAAEQVGSVDNALTMSMTDLADEYSVYEVNVVDDTEKIVASNRPEYLGFDMATSAQAAEFLILLDGTHTELVQDYMPMSYDQNVYRKYAGVVIDGGFVQLGYNADEFQEQIATRVVGITRNRHVGAHGRLLVIDAQGHLLSLNKDVSDEEIAQSTELNEAIAAVGPGQVFKATFLGEPIYGMYEEAEGYRIVDVLPFSEAHFERDTSVLVTSFMEILVFASLFSVIYFLIKRLVVDNIRRINTTLGAITAGDLNASVDVRSNQEFASLSDDINQTVSALKHAIAEAAARIDAELEYARTIQRSALPMVFPPYPSHTDFQIFASMDAAKEVGGDFYDFYLLDDDHLVFLIADVSGKGIPAAMFMMKAKTLLKSLAESGLACNEVLTRANNELCEGNEAEMFVTVWMGMIDLETGHVAYANAGHNPPVIAHENGEFSYHVVRPNLVLAGMEGMRYRAHELDMEPGDILFLYTDGVTEATDANDELFGEDRLLTSLNKRVADDVDQICKGVHADVDLFVGDSPQFDDITVMAIRYVGRDNHDDA